MERLTPTLKVYRGTTLTDTYLTVLSLRPSDEDKICDCGEHRALTPGADGALITCAAPDQPGCSGPDPKR